MKQIRVKFRQQTFTYYLIMSETVNVGKRLKTKIKNP